MTLDRRRLLQLSALGGAVPALAAMTHAAPAAPMSTFGIDATQLGVRAGPGDQTQALQQAIDRAAGARVPLVLGPGIYNTGEIRLPAGAQFVGVRGATRLVFTGGASLFSARGADHITLAGLVLDGGNRPLPSDRGLIHLADCAKLHIADCEIFNVQGQGIALQSVEGAVTGTAITNASDCGIFSLDGRGLTLADNTVRGSGNNGIQVWRSDKGDDGTLILDNRIEDTGSRSGGSGQNGNAINVFRAANVVVRGNRVARAAFSAVRANAASNIQITGNTTTALGEVAIYVEFGFEGAVIANNTVDGAALGVVVTNFNEGGRLAVVQGNLIRNLSTKRPAGTDPNDSAGVGIAVEADAAVTGNVIENAPTVGISLGWAQYLRDVSVTGNVVRNAAVGISVSVSPGAGAAVIANNLISGAARGAIVAMERNRAVTDLVNDGSRYAQLAINGNRVR